MNIVSESLKMAKKGNWKEAHDLVEHLSDKQSSHVHAYLHRVEGDIWNADYWYQRANKTRPTMSIEEEWNELWELYGD